MNVFMPWNVVSVATAMLLLSVSVDADQFLGSSVPVDAMFHTGTGRPPPEPGICTESVVRSWNATRVKKLINTLNSCSSAQDRFELVTCCHGEPRRYLDNLLCLCTPSLQALFTNQTIQVLNACNPSNTTVTIQVVGKACNFCVKKGWANWDGIRDNTNIINKCRNANGQALKDCCRPVHVEALGCVCQSDIQKTIYKRASSAFVATILPSLANIVGGNFEIMQMMLVQETTPQASTWITLNLYQLS